MDQNKQPVARAQSLSSAKPVDPLREKLKAWQASHGRSKENQLPWQPRFRRVVNEIDGTTASKQEKNQRLPPKPPSRPSKSCEQQPKTPSKRTVLTSQENKPHVAKQEDERRRKLENWKKMKLEKNVDQIKNKIPRPAAAPDLTRKPSINFVERNKILAGKRNTMDPIARKTMNPMARKTLEPIARKTVDPIARRNTVADLHLKIRRSSLEKVRRHSNRRSSNYYCLKPEVSRKLANRVKNVSAAAETSKLDDELAIEGVLEDTIATGFPARRESAMNHQRVTGSPEFKEENVPQSLKSGRRRELGENIRAAVNYFSTPMADREPLKLKPTTSNFFHDNFNTQFLLSPVKHFSQHNLYSLTPVRRSARLSAACNSHDVFDLDKIPSNLLSSALFRENPALGCLMEDRDSGDDCI